MNGGYYQLQAGMILQVIARTLQYTFQAVQDFFQEQYVQHVQLNGGLVRFSLGPTSSTRSSPSYIFSAWLPPKPHPSFFSNIIQPNPATIIHNLYSYLQ